MPCQAIEKTCYCKRLVPIPSEQMQEMSYCMSNCIHANRCARSLSGILKQVLRTGKPEYREESAESCSVGELRKLYKDGKVDDHKFLLDMLEVGRVRIPVEIMGGGIQLNGIIYKIEKVLKSPKFGRRKVTVRGAKSILIETELEKYLQSDQIVEYAIHLAESDGIVFIDGIDKIVSGNEARYSADASAEGV